MKYAVRVVISSAAMLIACDPDQDGDDTGTEGANSSAESSVGGDTDSAGPGIVEVSTNHSVIDSGRVLEITVTVSHPQSLDAIVGGSVRSGEETLVSLGEASPGTLVGEIEWEQLSMLNDELGGDLTLEIEVIDDADNAASETLVVSICSPGELECDGGECVDIDASDDNCGACAYECGGEEFCQNGTCYQEEYFVPGPSPESDERETVSSTLIPTSARPLDVADFNLGPPKSTAGNP